MDSGESLTAHMLELNRNGRGAYLTAHPNPVLLLDPLPPAEDDGSEWTSFNTNTFDTRQIGSMSEAELDAAARLEGRRLVTIAKAANNPWRGRVSLGRARNNDLTIASNAVSKLHAHFTVGADGNASITDAGSHNGTTLNGVRLEGSHPVPLHAGDRLDLGNVRATFHTPESLCDFLAAQLLP